MSRVSIIILVLFMVVSCKKDSTSGMVIEPSTGELLLIDEFPTDVLEPSGLSFGPNHQTLLTVSDHTNLVYELDLQGKILRTFNYEGKDLEGVTYNPDQNLVVIAEEADREITLIDYASGDLLQTYKINIPSNSTNSGLEGVSYNTNNKLYYIVNEANPELMIVWDPSLGIINEADLGFASDYSGIFVENERSLLWFVSDQSKALYQCDYNAQLLKKYNLGIVKFEGVAVDREEVFLINDATAMLYHYRIINN